MGLKFEKASNNEVSSSDRSTEVMLLCIGYGYHQSVRLWNLSCVIKRI